MVVMPKDLAKMRLFSKKTVPSLDLELIIVQSGSSAEAGSDFGLDLNRNNIGHKSGTHFLIFKARRKRANLSGTTESSKNYNSILEN